jgi:hypothetical protein
MKGKRFMVWLLIPVGVVVVAILGLLMLGLLQPVKHSVTRVIHLKQAPETVFPVIASNEASWSSTVLKMEKIPDIGGKPAAKMTLKWGHLEMIVIELERKPPTRLVTRMAKAGGPAFGTWTYELGAERDGCYVSLTEEGEMANPFYRAFGRLRGLDANVRQTLADLAKRFDESYPFP